MKRYFKSEDDIPKIMDIWDVIKPKIKEAAANFAKENALKRAENQLNKRKAEETRAELGLGPIPLTEHQAKKRKQELSEKYCKLTKQAAEVKKNLDSVYAGYQVINVNNNLRKSN